MLLLSVVAVIFVIQAVVVFVVVVVAVVVMVVVVVVVNHFLELYCKKRLAIPNTEYENPFLREICYLDLNQSFFPPSPVYKQILLTSIKADV